MFRAIIMLSAAINLVAVACLINANRFYLILICQFLPVALAVGLTVFALAHFMGWPA